MFGIVQQEDSPRELTLKHTESQCNRGSSLARLSSRCRGGSIMHVAVYSLIAISFHATCRYYCQVLKPTNRARRRPTALRYTIGTKTNDNVNKWFGTWTGIFSVNRPRTNPGPRRPALSPRTCLFQLLKSKARTQMREDRGDQPQLCKRLIARRAVQSFWRHSNFQVLVESHDTCPRIFTTQADGVLQ